ncbi:hypothetical protein GQ600_319 [Phytophthora cactorum]|nr:hypothetical protein GQ600_319 [Phytophthora cactorum]
MSSIATTTMTPGVRTRTSRLEAWRIVEPRTSATTNQMQRALDQRYDLAGKDLLELARCGKTPAEIEQIVTSLFDAPLATLRPNSSRSSQQGVARRPGFLQFTLLALTTPSTSSQPDSCMF